MKDSILDFVMIAMGFFTFATLYYVFILGPRDQALYDIMDCMGESRSEEAYKACVEQQQKSLSYRVKTRYGKEPPTTNHEDRQ